MLLIEAPFPAAAAGDVEKEKTVEQGQFAHVDRRKELSAELELPMKLKISHGHLTAADKGGDARLQSQRDSESTDELDNSAKPQLSSYRWLRLS